MDWKSGSGVSVFSVHPGVVNTELTRHLSINRCIDSILYFIGDCAENSRDGRPDFNLLRH